MKATEARLLEFLEKSRRFVIPIYQRTYSWGESECRQLWDDILRAGRSDKISVHFVGSVVYVEEGLFAVMNQPPLLVIDGQQRLTTVTLLIEALARALGDTEPLEGFSARKLRHYYLLNELEDGEKRYKLLLSQTDKSSLIALLERHPAPTEPSIRIEENFAFFTKWIEDAADEIVAICRGLAKLVVVDISLNRAQDNPQLIFESLNSTGRELSQADLIRNFVLMGLEPKAQTKLYNVYWRPMEVMFGQQAYSAYSSHFDRFMRHFLTVRTGEIPNVSAVYAAFKSYARSSEVESIEALVADIYRNAGHYCAMALGLEKQKELADAFHDLRELKVDVAYPFLLELYADYADGLLSVDDFHCAVRLVESYVFRRAVCGIPTNSLNKTFANFGRDLDKSRYLDSIQAHFLLLPSYRRFPANDEFQRELKKRDLYNFRSRSYWLRRMENHNRKEILLVDAYTIEHILPQNPNLSAAWQTELGPEWERIQKTYLHTLGNLTLTGYNSEYSDLPFARKRDMSGGFRESPIRLNAYMRHAERWGEAAICQRADQLAAKAVAVWPEPQLDSAALDTFRPRSKTGGYTIADHPYLAAGPLTEVFAGLRKEILALDPVVTEEFLKLYVAYRAETNFVDVVPQAKRLRLSLNMQFHEIYDPRGICKDVTALGRWGNGDVEIGLTSLDDLPYVMGLIRQSLERQMGDDSTSDGAAD